MSASNVSANPPYTTWRTSSRLSPCWRSMRSIRAAGRSGSEARSRSSRAFVIGIGGMSVSGYILWRPGQRAGVAGPSVRQRVTSLSRYPLDGGGRTGPDAMEGKPPTLGGGIRDEHERILLAQAEVRPKGRDVCVGDPVAWELVRVDQPPEADRAGLVGQFPSEALLRARDRPQESGEPAQREREDRTALSGARGERAGRDLVQKGCYVNRRYAPDGRPRGGGARRGRKEAPSVGPPPRPRSRRASAAPGPP